jgi:hypothetical protein
MEIMLPPEFTPLRHLPTRYILPPFPTVASTTAASNEISIESYSAAASKPQKLPKTPRA